MRVTDPDATEARVVNMYARHPFPGIREKGAKADREMGLRLALLAVKRADYAGKHVLDAGCGTGEYSCWYARQGAQVTGIDLAEPSLQAAADYARREGLTSVAFLKQSVLGLDFRDESFDYVSCMGVLHHTPDPYRGFQELCRVLRPGGILVISLYNKFSRAPHNVKQALVRRLAGDDLDRRVAVARRLFRGTCRALRRNHREDADAILYDAFGIPHESRHSVGEALRWFDQNNIAYLGACGPITMQETLRALALLRRPEFESFTRFFDGYPVLRRLVDVLPRFVPAAVGRDAGCARSPSPRPSVVSRGLVQLAWVLLGFRFSIFSISGLKRARTIAVP